MMTYPQKWFKHREYDRYITFLADTDEIMLQSEVTAVASGLKCNIFRRQHDVSEEHIASI
jgi:hypothetical protein